MECIAHYDNSPKNPSNPDSNSSVFWGDQTWQEMMIGWMDFAFDLPKEGAAKSEGAGFMAR